jgi:predicted DNA-binding protein YlxM (UPF0122 family)
MEHHMKRLDKAEIDKLISLVNSARPDLDALEKLGMKSLSHIGHLYVMDYVTLKELSGFWGICRNGVRRRLKDKVKSKSQRIWKIVKKSQKAEIKLSPKDAFPDDVGEYINFLKWRSENKTDNSISVSEAASILGVSRSTIYRYIKTGELHTCGDDVKRIMRFSFLMLVEREMLETEIKLNILKKYIQTYRGNSNIPAETPGTSFVDHNTPDGTHVPLSVKRDT